MARNKSEAEPTIEGASDALMHVLRTDATRDTPGDDGFYLALTQKDKEFYAALGTGDIDNWAQSYSRWLKTKDAQTEI